jgi:hypothetical protein
MTPPYLNLAGGYAYCPLRVGLVLRNPQGREVYFRPGDQESAFRRTLEAFAECEDMTPTQLDYLTDVALGDYFA